ncbi:Spo0B C-terminal domain-containing protein [Evansella clarkii]|jgi:stage 0 sporulation protein B (sporulation initiation phosphotransferase)|uniref:Spo0B C-terminal domain-containing protein n=1 Tax=Evansella clarkii TaxID=79879 RepID=UPI0009985A02|nr:Spo0B C-terminal domain-containing protein [Evansella clarkii]
MAREREILEILKNYRHDWLNRLQLIKGNIDMGRIDRAATIIDEVIQQSRNESHLTNMNIPKLASKLVTFNWESHPYFLAVETVTGEKDWSEFEHNINEILSGLFSLFDSYANYGDDNHLLIIFKDIEGFKLELDFQGELLLDSSAQRKFLDFRKKNEYFIEKMEWDNKSCFIVLDADV